MMGKPAAQKTPRQLVIEKAKEKDLDVLRVLNAKKAMTPTEIAWAIEKLGGDELRGWGILRPEFLPPKANTSLVNSVLRRIKAVKVGRGLWLKPGAKVKAGK